MLLRLALHNNDNIKIVRRLDGNNILGNTFYKQFGSFILGTESRNENLNGRRGAESNRALWRIASAAYRLLTATIN